MKKPIIMTIDDDPQVSRAVSRDLRKRFTDRYRVMSTISPNEALNTTIELKKMDTPVALFLSDQRMPEMSGVELLKEVRTYYPDSKRLLLTAYSDIEAAIKAINDAKLDYYLLKPWNPPEEKLYPVLEDLLEEWKAGYQPVFNGVKIVGYNYSPKTHGIKDYLTGNLVPYRFYDVESDEKAQQLMRLIDGEPADLPSIIFQDGSFLKDPEIKPVAKKLGMNPQAGQKVYDVVIVGAGPAGLAAAVYGSSEGLNTLLIERRAPGGQAGTSSRIENYLGFPNGLSGAELTRRAVTQATRFGTELLSPGEVTAIRINEQYKEIELADGTCINTQCVVLTTGVRYRKLAFEGSDRFTGAGIYYGSAMTEAQTCNNEDIFIVGGGNSAGQAAVYLAGFARRVTILIRGQDLSGSMSRYLIDQIEELDNVIVMERTEVLRASGDRRLEQLTLMDNRTSKPMVVPARALFVFIGARPTTEWLEDTLITDSSGYIETGRDLYHHKQFSSIWNADRDPYLLETSLPGVLAAGDVRAGTMNRVASAVGDGAMAIKFVHEYLCGRI